MQESKISYQPCADKPNDFEQLCSGFWEQLPIIKSPMVLKPGYFAVGTFNSAGMRTFAVVHHDQPKGLRISLVGEEFDQWIVGCVDPGSVLASLRNDSMGQ